MNYRLEGYEEDIKEVVRADKEFLDDNAFLIQSENKYSVSELLKWSNFG